MRPAQTIVRPCQECQGKKRCPNDPLTESHFTLVNSAPREIVTHGFGEFSFSKGTDEAITETFANILRMAPEDYKNLGEYVASIMRDELKGVRFLRVLLAPLNTANDLELSPLTSRLTAMRVGNRVKVSEPGGQMSFADADTAINILEQLAFRMRIPIILDQETRLRLMFHNLKKDDDGCDVFSLDGMMPPSKDSITIMPIYYRMNEEPSGLVVMEGDLRCDGSGARGFSKTYWSARLAMGIATQISFMLTHRYDTLTILPKRADFQVELAQGVKDMKSGRVKSLHLVMVDVDDFKSVNTKYRYDGGDKVLCRVADVLRASVGANDSVFRYGGEEFMGLIRNAGSMGKAAEIGERMRANVAKTNISVSRPSEDGEGDHVENLRVTCSIGVIDVSEYISGTNGFANDEIVNQIADSARKGAEKMLKHAKDSGKNMVVAQNPNSDI
jgi:diguanylate cyclase (GGDEF)-like protein